MAEKIVQIDHVTKKYKERTVLDDVSLSIWTGDVIGLLGGNGAGKTTLMRAIAGSIPVDSGEISFLGERRIQIYILICLESRIFDILADYLG